MCGIAAIVSKATLGAASNLQFEGQLRRMNACMRHRGPDSKGLYVGDGIGLGMTRLAIVGGDSGQQPIWNEDKTITLVCNGEIYNYKELQSQLEAAGHVFSTASDVEVIVHLYEEFGNECVQYMKGIFAFALWDARNMKLLAARDQSGVKPMYYSETADQIMFSSQFNALLTMENVDREMDEKGFHAYHAFRFCPAPETMVKGIKKLGSGEYLVVENGIVSKAVYWRPAVASHSMNATIPLKVKINELKRCLFQAVQAQATSEVKTGILLSGGLDSSALLALHRQSFTEVPDTFTVAFTAPKEHATVNEYDELAYARDVAEEYGARHTDDCFGAQDVLDELPRIITALDEPIADPTAIPLWFAIRLARQAGVKVVYSGEGVDELFSGYDVYRQVYWLNVLRFLPHGLRNAFRSLLSKYHLPGQGLLDRSLDPVSEWYQGVGGVFTPRDGEIFTDDAPVSDSSRFDPQDYVRQILSPGASSSPLAQMTHFDMLTWLPENTLVKSDKISMAQSVELRVPFLSEEIVEFALELDDREKLRRGTGKWIVRKALQDLLIPSVLKRPKVGFPVPLTAWIYGEWKDFVLSTLLNPNAYTFGLYHSGYVEGLVSAPDHQRRRSARLLWTMISLELWHQYVYAPSIGAKESPLQSVIASS